MADESFVVKGEKFFSTEQFKEVMIRRSPEYCANLNKALQEAKEKKAEDVANIACFVRNTTWCSS